MFRRRVPSPSFHVTSRNLHRCTVKRSSTGVIMTNHPHSSMARLINTFGKARTFLPASQAMWSVANCRNPAAELRANVAAATSRERPTTTTTDQSPRRVWQMLASVTNFRRRQQRPAAKGQLLAGCKLSSDETATTSGDI